MAYVTKRFLASLFALALVAQSHPIAARGGPEPRSVWREAFQSSPVVPRNEAQFAEFVARFNIPPAIADRMRPKQVDGTLRYRFTVSVGGTHIRLRFSNEAGFAPLDLSAASVGIADKAFDVSKGSLRRVTFGGSPGVTIPVGAPALSDPVQLPVKAGSILIVSVAGRGPFRLSSNGGGALLAAAGDQSLAEHIDAGTSMTGRPILSAIEVLTSAPTRVIATLGDSITDGNRTSIDALHSWPEQLARRLAARPAGTAMSVANAGIGGNQVLANGTSPEFGNSALARLDRDVLRIGGLSHVIVLEGINDIGSSGKTPYGDAPVISPDDLIFGYRQIIARVRAHGAKIIFGTILPFEGAGYFTPEKERVRQAVNAWIRTSAEVDGVIDFDAVMRDPAHPSRLRAEFDSGDRLHPNEAGSKAMGDAIELRLFE